MVSTLDSHPADRGSIPHMYLNFFLFFLVILLRKYSLIIQKVQNSTQKLFVQFHYFKLFMYVYITYNEKKESKVLGHLLLITIIFWTVCYLDARNSCFNSKMLIFMSFRGFFCQACRLFYCQTYVYRLFKRQKRLLPTLFI